MSSSFIIFIIICLLIIFHSSPSICSQSSSNYSSLDEDDDEDDASLEAELARLGVAYSERDARHFLHLSGCVYSRPEAMDDCAWKIGWTVHSSAHLVCDPLGHRCAAFVAFSERRRQIVIAFRGTQSLLQLMAELGHSNWKRTVPFEWQRKKKGTTEIHSMGRTHAYFANALFKKWHQDNGRNNGSPQSLWATMVDQFYSLKIQDKDGYELIFTGHSLGGALASLASLKWALEEEKLAENVEEAQLEVIDQKSGQRHWMWKKQPLRVGLYTFGQPRVGCPQLARNIDALIRHRFRIVNGADIVPHLPPCNVRNWMCDSAKADSYFHHGIEIWYHHGWSWGGFSVCLQNEDPECSDSVLNKGAIVAKWSWLRTKLEGMLEEGKGTTKKNSLLTANNGNLWKPTMAKNWGQTMAKEVAKMAELWKFVADHRAYFAKGQKGKRQSDRWEEANTKQKAMIATMEWLNKMWNK